MKISIYHRNVLFLKLLVPAEIVSTKVGRAKVSSEETLSCSIRGHPLGPITWQKGNDTQSPEELK